MAQRAWQWLIVVVVWIIRIIGIRIIGLIRIIGWQWRTEAGKKRGFTIATFVLSVGLVALVVSRTGETALMLAAAAIVGVGYAGAQIFPLAMMPDVAAEDAKRSGVNRIGMISGLWSGFELLGLALGPALLGIILAIGGYAEASGAAVQQSDAAKWAIVIGVSLVPAVLCFVSLVPLSRYRLDAQLREASSGE